LNGAKPKAHLDRSAREDQRHELRTALVRRSIRATSPRRQRNVVSCRPCSIPSASSLDALRTASPETKAKRRCSRGARWSVQGAAQTPQQRSARPRASQRQGARKYRTAIREVGRVVGTRDAYRRQQSFLLQAYGRLNVPAAKGCVYAAM